MRRKNSIMALTIILMMTVMLTNVNAQTDKVRIEGTWNVTETAPNGFQFRWHYSFMPGKSTSEGILIATSELDLTPDPIIVTSQGVWLKTGIREFTTTRETYAFDSTTGDPLGTAKWRNILTVNDRGDEFSGREKLDVFDRSGVLIFSAQDSVRGVRMNVEPPPPAANDDLITPEIGTPEPYASRPDNPFLFWRKRPGNQRQ